MSAMRRRLLMTAGGGAPPATAKPREWAADPYWTAPAYLPLWTGLVFDLPIYDRGEAGPVEIWTRVRPTVTGSPVWVNSAYGRGVQLLAAGQEYDWGDQWEHREAKGAVTVAVIYTPPATGNTDAWAPLLVKDADLPGPSYAIRQSATALRYVGTIKVGATKHDTALATALVRGSTYLLLLRWESGGRVQLDAYNLPSGTLHSSVQNAANVAGVLDYTATAGYAKLRLGRGERNTSPQTLGTFDRASVWSRRLSDVEAGLYATDPWGHTRFYGSVPNGVQINPGTSWATAIVGNPVGTQFVVKSGDHSGFRAAIRTGGERVFLEAGAFLLGNRTTTRAVDGETISNVTLQGPGIIENYAPADNRGAVAAGNPNNRGSNWLMEDFEVRDSYAAASFAPIVPDAATRFQTIYSWDGVGQIGQDEFAPADFFDWRPAVIDKAVNELGMTGMRLEIYTGIQNSTDYWLQWQAGQITQGAYNQTRYVAEQGAPLQLAKLNWEIDQMVIPLDAAMGGDLKVNLCVIDYDPKGTFQHRNFPNDYAAMILAVVNRLVTRFGRGPDSVEMVNEPNLGNPQWTTTQITNALVATHDLLAANGHNPLFIAPSDSNTGSALGKIQTLAANPAAVSRLDIFSYHRYGENTADVQGIATAAASVGKMTTMNEKIGVSLGTFFEDLRVGNNSMWEKYAIAFPNAGSGAYYSIDPTTHVVTAVSPTLEFAKIFKRAPPGSVRIAATSTDATVTPLAFDVPGQGVRAFGLKNNIITEYGVAAVPGACGVRCGTSSTYRRVKSHHNERYGFHGGDSDASIWEDTEASHNGWGGVTDGNHGGTKISVADDCRFSRGRWHRNRGNAVWFDISNINFIIEDMVLSENGKQSIYIEISYGGIIRRNRIRHSGYVYARTGLMYDAAIGVGHSEGVTAEFNLIELCWKGLGLQHQQARTFHGTGLPANIRNITYRNNRVIVDLASDYKVAGIDIDYDPAVFGFDPFAPAANNRWLGNEYWAPTGKNVKWRWNRADQTFAQWQAIGHDVTGSLTLYSGAPPDVGMPTAGNVYASSAAEAGAGADATAAQLRAAGIVAQAGVAVDLALAALRTYPVASEAGSGLDLSGYPSLVAVTAAEAGLGIDAAVTALRAVQLVAQAGSGADLASGALRLALTIAEGGAGSTTANDRRLIDEAIAESGSGAELAGGLLRVALLRAEAGAGVDVVAGLLLAAAIVAEGVAGIAVAASGREQYAHPIGDGALGGWRTDGGSATDLWAAIDETTPDLTDFIVGPLS